MNKYVYALIDPRTNLPFYVGVTGNLRTRLSVHLSCRKTKKQETFTNRRLRLFAEIKAAGLKVEIRVLETCDIKKAGDIEKKYYQSMKASGVELLQAPHNFYKPFSWPSYARTQPFDINNYNY